MKTIIAVLAMVLLAALIMDDPTAWKLTDSKYGAEDYPDIKALIIEYSGVTRTYPDREP